MQRSGDVEKGALYIPMENFLEQIIIRMLNDNIKQRVGQDCLAIPKIAAPAKYTNAQNNPAAGCENIKKILLKMYVFVPCYLIFPNCILNVFTLQISDFRFPDCNVYLTVSLIELILIIIYLFKLLIAISKGLVLNLREL